MRLPSEPMDNLPTIPPPSSPSPPDPLALAHTSWLQPFVSYFDERGTDLQDHYSASKISPEVVRSGDGWITKKQLYRLLDRLARRENVPELGFTVGDIDYIDSLRLQLWRQILKRLVNSSTVNIRRRHQQPLPTATARDN